MDFTTRAADVAGSEVAAILAPLLDQVIDQKRKAEYEAGRGSGLGAVAAKRIGAGYIGLECERELAFRFHRAVPEAREGGVTPGELERHAQAGHWAEHATADWLTLAGFTILTLDEKTGKQISWMAAEDAGGQYRMAGEVDGVIVDVMHPRLRELLEPPCIWESKKGTDKKWKKFFKDGVKKADPKYYGQVQTNMAYLGAKNTLFSMLNLDSMRYHFELIPFDLHKAQWLTDRAVGVIGSKSPFAFPRLGRAEDDLVCKFCDYRRQCWNVGDPKVDAGWRPGLTDEVPF